jgi:hypothetical protein
MSDSEAMSMEPMNEMLAVRHRFAQDQADAEYVEYTLAMERIGAGRRWRRERRRFLLGRGYSWP